MLDYWKCDNNNVAEQKTLNSVIGFLKAKQELGKDVTPEEILKFIDERLKEETDQLNEQYPDRKWY